MIEVTGSPGGAEFTVSTANWCISSCEPCHFSATTCSRVQCAAYRYGALFTVSAQISSCSGRERLRPILTFSITAYCAGSRGRSSATVCSSPGALRSVDLNMRARSGRTVEPPPIAADRPGLSGVRLTGEQQKLRITVPHAQCGDFLGVPDQAAPEHGRPQIPRFGVVTAFDEHGDRGVHIPFARFGFGRVEQVILVAVPENDLASRYFLLLEELHSPPASHGEVIYPHYSYASEARCPRRLRRGWLWRRRR
jgi:hypothetical protein